MKVGPQADKFGEFLTTNLRDAAIDFIDTLLAKKWKSDRLKALQADVAKFTPKQRAVIRRCVVTAIDNGIHDFLIALEEEHDNEGEITVVVAGKNIAEQSDGLAGELFPKKGWFSRFSEHGEPSASA